MALCPGDTTQWDDIQRKLGNFAPKPKEPTRDEIEKKIVEACENIDQLEPCTLNELDKLEDDVEEDILASYRRKRIEELKAAKKTAKFGDVRHVDRSSFVEQVTDASANGQWVLVFLYVDSSTACQYLMQPWAEAARRFPAVKFMRGVASEIMPDFPDASTPFVLVYHNGECEKQIKGIEEWGGAQCNVSCVEWVLSSFGALETELEDDPRTKPGSIWCRADRHSSCRDSDSEEEDIDVHSDRCFSSTRIGRQFGRHLA